MCFFCTLQGEIMATQGIKNIKNPFLKVLVEYGMITVSIWIMVVGIYFFNTDQCE